MCRVRAKHTRTHADPSHTHKQTHRSHVLLCCSEDEYDASFVFGPDASNADIHGRSVSPLIRKVVEGYNVCVLLFGATGAPQAAAHACRRHH